MYSSYISLQIFYLTVNDLEH